MKEDSLKLYVITSVFRGHKAKIDHIATENTPLIILYKEYPQNIQLKLLQKVRCVAHGCPNLHP